MSYTVEQFAVDCARQKVNAELLYDTDTANPNPFGIRLRFYGKDAPKNKMVWGVGEDYDAASYDAVMCVKRKQYLTLDFSFRPWAPVSESGDGEWMV